MSANEEVCPCTRLSISRTVFPSIRVGCEFTWLVYRARRKSWKSRDRENGRGKLGHRVVSRYCWPGEFFKSPFDRSSVSESRISVAIKFYFTGGESRLTAAEIFKATPTFNFTVRPSFFLSFFLSSILSYFSFSRGQTLFLFWTFFRLATWARLSPVFSLYLFPLSFSLSMENSKNADLISRANGCNGDTSRIQVKIQSHAGKDRTNSLSRTGRVIGIRDI